MSQDTSLYKVIDFRKLTCNDNGPTHSPVSKTVYSWGKPQPARRENTFKKWTFHYSERRSSWEKWPLYHNSHLEENVDVKETLLEMSFQCLFKYIIGARFHSYWTLQKIFYKFPFISYRPGPAEVGLFWTMDQRKKKCLLAYHWYLSCDIEHWWCATSGQGSATNNLMMSFLIRL